MELSLDDRTLAFLFGCPFLRAQKRTLGTSADPLKGQAHIGDVLFPLDRRDPSLSLRHVASAMLHRDALSRWVLAEIVSFRGSTDEPE